MQSNASIFRRYERELEKMVRAAMPRTPDPAPAPRPVPVLVTSIGARLAAAPGR